MLRLSAGCSTSTTIAILSYSLTQWLLVHYKPAISQFQGQAASCAFSKVLITVPDPSNHCVEQSRAHRICKCHSSAGVPASSFQIVLHLNFTLWPGSGSVHPRNKLGAVQVGKDHV